MSDLNIRPFAKIEPSNGENGTDNQQVGNQRLQESTGYESGDSDAGIQYLAPDDTPVGKYFPYFF